MTDRVRLADARRPRIPNDRRNRVDPWGRLCASPERGMLMGNRGRLLDDSGRMVTEANARQWITCTTSWALAPNDRRVYTPLFFLDEATSFAAGHRPCAECRNERYRAFKKAIGLSTAGAIHERLLEEHRHAKAGLVQRPVADLPVGTIVAVESAALLVSPAGLRPWSFAGYGPVVAARPLGPVQVLTPASVVAIFERGAYVPDLHQTAR